MTYNFLHGTNPAGYLSTLSLKHRSSAGSGKFIAWYFYNQNGQPLIRRAARLKQALSSQKAREEYRKSFALGDMLPPETLPMNRWSTWNFLTKIELEQPEKMIQLLTKDPRQYGILVAYYCLEPSENAKSTFSSLGKAVGGYTGERIRQLKNEGLEYLGLVDKN